MSEVRSMRLSCGCHIGITGWRVDFSRVCARLSITGLPINSGRGVMRDAQRFSFPGIIEYNPSHGRRYLSFRRH